MEKFFNYVLIDRGDVKITVGSAFVFLIVIILGNIILKLTNRYLNRLQKRQVLSSTTKATISTLIKYVVIIIGAVIIIQSSGLYKPFKKLIEYDFLVLSNFRLSILHILTIILIGILARVLLNIINGVLEHMVKINQIEPANKKSIFLLITYSVYTVASLMMLNAAGLNLSILLGGAAALLVGLGLGLQQIFSDIVSGIFLLIEGSVKIGDVMEADGTVGRVTNINLRTSEIQTRDGITIIIPNHKFITESVINWSHNATITRFKVGVGVAYGTDPQLIKRLLLECSDQHPKIISSKAYKSFVRLTSFGDSSLDFELYFWSKDGFIIENIKSDLRFMILSKFDANNVQIPFPQRDLHIIEPKKSFLS